MENTREYYQEKQTERKKGREGGKKEGKERKKILWFSEGLRRHPGGILTNRRI